MRFLAVLLIFVFGVRVAHGDLIVTSSNDFRTLSIKSNELVFIHGARAGSTVENSSNSTSRNAFGLIKIQEKSVTFSAESQPIIRGPAEISFRLNQTNQAIIAYYSIVPAPTNIQTIIVDDQLNAPEEPFPLSLSADQILQVIWKSTPLATMDLQTLEQKVWDVPLEISDEVTGPALITFRGDRHPLTYSIRNKREALMHLPMQKKNIETRAIITLEKSVDLLNWMPQSVEAIQTEDNAFFRTVIQK